MVFYLPKLVLAASTVSALLVAPYYPASAAPVPPHSHAAVPALAPVGAVNSNHETTSATSHRPGQGSSCSPIAAGDYVHVSSTPPATASGHGWWKRGNCTAASAQVDIVLQEYFNDGSWRDRGQAGQGTYIPGGGAGHRATARAVCQTTTRTSWRSVVNVYPVGESGSASSTTSKQDINCRVP